MIPLPAPDFKPYQRVPFYEAIQWFRQQAPWISGSSWSTMARLAADKGEQISSTVLLSMLDDVWGHMDRALAEGKPYNEFVRDVAAPIYSRWRQADSPRLKLIYHNNIGNALMAGREAQMRDPAVLAVRPYVMFDGIGDWRQTIDICKPRDGVILPADDPWWEQNSPLLHHGAVESSTLIQTGRGKIPACDVRCGDSVLTHTGAYRKVTTAVHKYVLRAKTRVLHLDSGKVMRVTDEHPILRTGSDGFIWKRADSLKVGDVLLENPDEFGRSLRCGVVNSQDCPSLSDDQRITFQIPGPCFPPGMAFPVQLNGDLEFLKGNIDVELTDRILCCRNRPEDSEQVVLLWGEFFPESIGNATSAKLSNGNRGHWVLERHSAATVCTDTGVGGCLTPEVMVGTATFGNGLGRKSADLDLINSGSDRNAVLFAPDGKPPIGPAVFPLKFSDTPVLAEVLGFNKVSANAPVTDVWSGYKHTRITSISVVVEDTQLSDFTVEVDESYVAGDIVLHNCRSGKITLDAEEVAEFGGVTDKAALTRLAPAQEGWGKPYSWVEWKPNPANYHAPLADEYQRWIQGQEYIHTKAEWDAKWQRVAAQIAALPAQAPEPKPTQDMRSGLRVDELIPIVERSGAVSVFADGDKLRGQTWRVQREDLIAVNGKEQRVSIVGELDQSVWAEVEQTMRSIGAEDGYYAAYARAGLFDERKDSARSPVKRLDMSKRSRQLGEALIYEDPNGDFRVTFAGSTALSAMKGRLRIEVYTTDPIKAQELTTKALAAVRLDRYDLDKPPNEDASTLARANRALWNLEGGEYRPAMNAADALRRLKSKGVDTATLTSRQNSHGYEEPRIEGRWKKFRNDGARYLYHQFRADSVVVRGVSGADGGKGGLLSTVERIENGIVIDGMSSSYDLQTGGAASTFARIVGGDSTLSAKEWHNDSQFTAVLHPRLLDRTDWYAFTGDKFGQTSGDAWNARRGADAHVKEIAEKGRSTNEVMFRNVVGREDMLLFAVSNARARTSLLNALKAAKVKTIRGQPVAEMVVVMKKPNDFKQLNPENPVHAFLMGKTDTCPEWTETYGDTNE